VPNERRTSTHAPNIRGILQCNTSTLTIKDLVQHKRQILEVFCNTAPRNFQIKDEVQHKRQI